MDAELKKTDVISFRVPPQIKDEIARDAHERGISVGDLLVLTYFQWKKEKAKTEEERKSAEEMYKIMEKGIRKARPMVKASIFLSNGLTLLDFINKLEKRRPSPLTVRRFYEEIMTQVKSSDALIEMVRAEFRDRFNIPELLMNKEVLQVYPDLIKIDSCGCHPHLHTLVNTSALEERITLVFRSFPSFLYHEAADFQRKIWKLCGRR